MPALAEFATSITILGASMSTFVFGGSRSTNSPLRREGTSRALPRFVVLRTLDGAFEEALTKRRFITGEELDARMAQLQSAEAPSKGPNQALRKAPCCKVDGTGGIVLSLHHRREDL